jgi:hypothetical protein
MDTLILIVQFLARGLETNRLQCRLEMLGELLPALDHAQDGEPE